MLPDDQEPQHLGCEESIREKGSPSLEKTVLERDLTTVFIYLLADYKENKASFSSRGAQLKLIRDEIKFNKALSNLL